MSSSDIRHLPSVYQEFIALSRYARYDNDVLRRENWSETVHRYSNFCRGILKNAKVASDLIEKTVNEIEDSLLKLDIMPSMRALMTAGPAAIRSPVAMYNCSYNTISGTGPTVELWDDKLEELGYDEPIKIKLHNPIVFDEAFFILLNGTGFGFSVERQFIGNLPTVGKTLSRSVYKKTAANYPKVPREDLSSYDKKSNTIVVADSKEGWASALRIFIVEMYNGNFSVEIDTSGVRPAGSVLKTFGGRASGPQALIEMFENLRQIFEKADGRKLSSIECHDVMCHIAKAVVVGGVRRCLPLDTMIQIDKDEWKPISEFSINDKIFYDDKYITVLNVFDQGEQEVFKIELDDGKYVESTANHRWLVYNKETDEVEWVMTKNLTENHGFIDQS